MLSLAIAWILLLLGPLDVSADEIEHISIVLTPRRYRDPRTLDNFTCGIDTANDASRLIAEQNTNYIFETFLDNKESDAEYQTKVFDVLTFSKDGAAEEMIEGLLCTPDMEDSSFYSLFLSPPKAQCNRRTFEDVVEASGVGYYLVYVNTTGNFSEVINKVAGSIDTFKQFYNGEFPKLCGTKQSMKFEPANARKETLLQMFNVLYNSPSTRNLDPAREKSCWSSDETFKAIIKGNLFDLSPKAVFKSANASGPESIGFARVDIERTATDRKALIFVSTEFPSAGGRVMPAGPEDIIRFDGPVIFNEGSNESEVFVVIKTDDNDEDPEAFQLALHTANAVKSKKRSKRSPGFTQGEREPSSSSSSTPLSHREKKVITTLMALFTIQEDSNPAKTPNGLQNCESWKSFFEESGKAMKPSVDEAERTSILKRMTPSIMNLVESFAEADNPTDQFQMFRKTSYGEVYSVFYAKVHTLPSKPRRETWFSTSLNHPRLFMNTKTNAERKDAVMLVYHLDVKKFKSEFADRIIHQKHASGFDNKNAKIEDLKNYVHRELLEEDRPMGNKKGSINHPWTKFNFALVGQKNHERFNECIKKVEWCDVLLLEDNKAKGFTTDQIGKCRPLDIGVGKAREQPQSIRDLGPDGYYGDGRKKSVTSKHSDQY